MEFALNSIIIVCSCVSPVSMAMVDVYETQALTQSENCEHIFLKIQKIFKFNSYSLETTNLIKRGIEIGYDDNDDVAILKICIGTLIRACMECI